MKTALANLNEFKRPYKNYKKFRLSKCFMAVDSKQLEKKKKCLKMSLNQVKLIID